MHNRAPWGAIIVFFSALVGQAAWGDIQFWLSNVPDYNWYHGCSPTSGGMVFGYWDNRPGYGNLYHGTAPMYANDNDGMSPEEDALYEMICSDEHIAQTYNQEECTHNNAPPSGDTGPNSIACFMHTDKSGGSTAWNIATGMRRYALYDDPDTSTNESYHFHSFTYYAPRPTWPDRVNKACVNFWDYKKEIDAGRPVLFDLSLNGGGHSVVGYGYWVDSAGDYWYAVRDTWQDGNSNGVYGVTAKMSNGQEWWKWRLRQQGENFGYAYFVDHVVLFIPNDDGPMQETQDYGNTFATAEPVGDETWRVETIYAGLTSGDWDYYQVWLDSGDRIVAMTQDNEGFNQAIDTVLRLYDPSGTYITYSDDFWSGTRTSHLWYRADQSGWWRLAVHGYNSSVTGDYVAVFYRQPVPEPGSLGMLVVGLSMAFGILRRRRASKG